MPYTQEYRVLTLQQTTTPQDGTTLGGLVQAHMDTGTQGVIRLVGIQPQDKSCKVL